MRGEWKQGKASKRTAHSVQVRLPVLLEGATLLLESAHVSRISATRTRRWEGRDVHSIFRFFGCKILIDCTLYLTSFLQELQVSCVGT